MSVREATLRRLFTATSVGLLTAGIGGCALFFVAAEVGRHQRLTYEEAVERFPPLAADRARLVLFSKRRAGLTTTKSIAVGAIPVEMALLRLNGVRVVAIDGFFQAADLPPGQYEIGREDEPKPMRFLLEAGSTVFIEAVAGPTFGESVRLCTASEAEPMLSALRQPAAESPGLLPGYFLVPEE